MAKALGLILLVGLLWAGVVTVLGLGPVVGFLGGVIVGGAAQVYGFARWVRWD